MSDNKVQYLKIETNKVPEHLASEVIFGFNDGSNSFYTINEVNFISSTVLEDEEGDLEQEYAKAKRKISNMASELSKKGFKIISAEEYKTAEVNMKENQKNSVTNGFSEEEKLVYEKTRDFFKEYDIKDASQRHFLSSLRKYITQGDEISELYLESHAEGLKKNLDDIFDVGMQSIICDFIETTQKEMSKPKKKSTSKM